MAKKKDILKVNFSASEDGKDIRLAFSDGTKMLFSKGGIAFALPRKKFTDELCVKKLADGIEYFTFEFDATEVNMIILGMTSLGNNKSGSEKLKDIVKMSADSGMLEKVEGKK